MSGTIKRYRVMAIFSGIMSLLLWFVENARLQCGFNQAGANDVVQAAFVVPKLGAGL